jgi:hypothetical protein
METVKKRKRIKRSYEKVLLKSPTDSLQKKIVKNQDDV